MKLWKHQAETDAKLEELNGIAYNASDPGTGKTIATLHYAVERDYRVIILAPKTLVEPAWANDLKKMYPDLDPAIAYASNRAKAFGRRAPVTITNIEAVNWLVEGQRLKLLDDYDLIVCDEATAFKNPSSQRSMNARQVFQRVPRRINMSGTPYNKTIADLWHQYFLLDKGARLGGSLSQFRFAFCTPKSIPGAPAGAVKWVDKEGALEQVTELVADITIRYERSECMDIPPNHIHWIKYKVSRRVRNAYMQMLKSAEAQLADGTLLVGANAAVARNKCLQLLTGAAYYYEDGDAFDPPAQAVIDSYRADLVADLINGRPASVVFYIWKHQRDALLAACKKRKLDVAVIDGDVPQRERGRIVDDFQAGKYRAVLMHPATGAHGLTLTRAKTVIFTTPPADRPDWWTQGIARIVRGGQDAETETIIICSEDTFEERVYRNIIDGADTNDAFLTYVKELAHG